MSPTKQLNEGFSLLEMLIVLVIVSLAALTMGSALPSLRERRLFTETIAKIDAALVQNRTMAIKRSSNSYVTFDFERRGWQSTAHPEWQFWPESIEISMISAKELGSTSNSAIMFLPDGTTSGAEIKFHSAFAPTAKRRLHWLTGAVHAE